MGNLKLKITPKSDKRLKILMKYHYSKPKGFVGRSICYAIYYDDVYYGHIIGGSATLHLPNRNKYVSENNLNLIINNVFFRVVRKKKYPIRNFTTKIVKLWMKQIAVDWKQKYGDDVIAFETLIELPRTGELYKRAGYKEIGITKGYTCKRSSEKKFGVSLEKWGGKRVWNTKELKPKRVMLCLV